MNSFGAINQPPPPEHRMLAPAAVGPSQSEPTAAPFPFRNGAKPVNQTATTMPRSIYTCICEREGVGTVGVPPVGWRMVTRSTDIWGDTPQCPDCIAFAASVSAAEPDRTHDSSSAVNDDEPAVIALRAYHPDNIKRPAARIGNLWQATLIFHDDKGVVESKGIIAAPNPLDASDLLRAMVPSYRIADLVSIIITPPPVNVQG